MRAYVVFCHPRRDSFTGAALDRVLAGLASGGHEARVSDLYRDGFDPVLDRAAHAAHGVDHRGHPDARPGIAPYVEHLAWCDALVLVHPTWWSGQPAMLKGWFDRVLVHGVAYDLPAGASRIRPRLTHIRRVVVVTSHGSPKHINLLQGESGKHVARRAIRALCGLRCRSRWIALYGIDRVERPMLERGSSIVSSGGSETWADARVAVPPRTRAATGGGGASGGDGASADVADERALRVAVADDPAGHLVGDHEGVTGPSTVNVSICGARPSTPSEIALPSITPHSW